MLVCGSSTHAVMCVYLGRAEWLNARVLAPLHLVVHPYEPDAGDEQRARTHEDCVQRAQGGGAIAKTVQTAAVGRVRAPAASQCTEGKPRGVEESEVGEEEQEDDCDGARGGVDKAPARDVHHPAVMAAVEHPGESVGDGGGWGRGHQWQAMIGLPNDRVRARGVQRVAQSG